MFQTTTISFACLVIACLLGVVVWLIQREVSRRKREREHSLKHQISEMTGEELPSGHTTVKDLEKKFGQKG